VTLRPIRTLVVVVAATMIPAALPRVAWAGDAPTEAQRDEAKRRFERGVSLLKDGALDAALAEFQASRALAVTRGNTRNAAVVLRKLHRFDESLDLFESLATFPDLGDEREAVMREIEELRALVGTIDVRVSEPGAAVSVDGRDRGKLPLAASLRVAAGAHVVRVVREGRLPFEARVEVAGRATVVVEGSLVSVAELGRLRVEEATGAGLDVVVDGKIVGKTPWEGALGAGEHVVALRGPAGIGTGPTAVTVRADEIATAKLAATRLDARLHVDTEAGVAIVVDGARLAVGTWEDALPSGAHRVEIRSPAGPTVMREITLVAGETRRLTLTPRDGAEAPASFRFVLEAAVGLGVAPSLGGDVASSCSSGCTRGLALGALARAGVGVALPSGLGLGVEGGYLTLGQKLEGRPDTVLPNGRAPAAGTATDKLHLSAIVLGANATYTRGDRLRWGARLGAGLALASVRDDRDGAYAIGATTATTGVSRREGGTYVYAMPEVRLGLRVSSRITLGASLGLMALFAAKTPTRTPTSDELLLSTSDFGTYPQATMAGGLILVPVPSLGLAAEL
jgi:hypothetical protein